MSAITCDCCGCAIPIFISAQAWYWYARIHSDLNNVPASIQIYPQMDARTDIIGFVLLVKIVAWRSIIFCCSLVSFPANHNYPNKVILLDTRILFYSSFVRSFVDVFLPKLDNFIILLRKKYITSALMPDVRVKVTHVSSLLCVCASFNLGKNHCVEINEGCVRVKIRNRQISKYIGSQ